MTLDLLSEALDDPAPRRITHYTDLGPALSINVPEGFALHLASLAPHQPALRIESGLPPWLSLEGWLPPAPEATACRLDLDLLAERDCAGNAFLRVIGDDGFGIDAPGRPLTLGGGPVSVSLPLDPAEGRQRKLVLLIERPPTAILLRRFALIVGAGP